ncbi:MAG: hypothetical protein ACRDRH_02560 [Pseudonocardia sp.]
MSTKVTFVELTAYEGVLPLATGYLQSYASQDPEIAAECSFAIYSQPVNGDRAAIADELIAMDSEVYALSCYLWNMRLMRWVLERLVAERPTARFILGGPQVMHHIADYVPSDRENIIVCNGEGERTFHAYLKQVVRGEADLEAVPGISFWRAGDLITTLKSERIRDLMEIPSPFTTGVFEPGRYHVAILETNRGCPFSCGFCAWGAATNDKVYQFAEDRVRDDITWICENQFMSIFIADANWGIGPRDVEFTKHIVKCKEQFGSPYRVDMAAAKNRPDRMAVITETLARGGLLTSQPISMQTLDTQTLEVVQRKNIRLDAYTKLQRTLREKQINSHIELIWPLPGETLESYRLGIAKLCRNQADTMIIYPQLLLHNTPIYQQRDLLGVQTASAPSEIAEAEIVTSTNWATFADYEEGVWFAYALHALYNLRGLYYLANYLDRNGISTFDVVYSDAVEYFQSRTDSALVQYFAESVKSLGNYDFRDSGTVAYMVLHAHRAEFDELLTGFVRTRAWWSDPDARAAFELDLIARPYVFAEPVRIPDYAFEKIRCAMVGDHRILAALPPVIGKLVAELEMPGHEGRVPDEVLIEHTPGQKVPVDMGFSLDEKILYCQGMFICLRDLLPSFGSAPTPVSG